jgi:hypothetical protein
VTKAVSAFSQLSLAIQCRVRDAPSDDKIKVIMYFDEYHTLSGPVRSGKTVYDFLCSAFDDLVSLPLFVIFLSTNSHVRQDAPMPIFARSARARASPATLQAPITEVPFDCSPELPIAAGTLKLADVSTIPFMARFGRPL